MKGTPLEQFAHPRRHRRQLRRGWRARAVRDPESAASKLHHPERRWSGALVALGRPYAHGVRDRGVLRRARGGGRQGSGRAAARAAEQDQPRHVGVLEACGRKGRLGQGRCRPGARRGVAVHESFGSFVAEVAEVPCAKGRRVEVDRVVCAVDCGIAVNPDVVRAQMEGGIGYGLGRALSARSRSRAGGAGAAQLRRLPVAADRRDAERRGAHRAERRRAERRRRARGAAARAGGGQRRRPARRAAHPPLPARQRRVGRGLAGRPGSSAGWL